MKSMTALTAAVTFCSAACAGAGEKFEVKYAADFSPAPMSVSVFGVLHDGLMAEEGARVLGHPIFHALHQHACEIAFDGALGRSNPDLFAFLDKHARDDGITDDLLEKVAGYAKGDFILAFQMFGRPPGHSEQTSERKPVLVAHGGDMSGPSPYPKSNLYKEAGTFDVSASFFSVRLHHTVALLTMEYSGGSVADAMIKLSDKLAATFPSATCAGWNLPPASPTEESILPRASRSAAIL
jgi:hypothetical protein